MLTWKKRCKRKETEISVHRIWESKCNNYKVVHSHITLAEGTMSDRYYAIRIDTRDDGTRIEHVLKTHRKKNTAMKTCEKDSSENE